MFVDEFLNGTALPLPIVVVRLVGAVLLSAAVGIEREMTAHSAGVRTHMLIGLASCIFALITLHLVEEFRDETSSVRLDPIRLVEAVTAGVAFLAAGMIVLTGGKVKNLTTGAVMWLAAAIGVCAGLGLWMIAVLAAGLGLLISLVLKAATDRL